MDTLVIGGSGLVGSHILRRFSKEGLDVTGTYNTSPSSNVSVQIDKTDEAAVSALICDRDPDLIIDVAAFHDVDACEVQRDKTWSVNVTGARNLAVAANDVNAHLVYLSTDYVFSGEPTLAPFVETDPVNPVNYYAQSKYAGEQAAKIAEQSTILRSGVLYGLSRSNFMTWALDKLREKDTIGIVDDQVSTPTYAGDVAEACLRVGQRGLTGLYHAAGPESISRYEFTRRLAEAYGHDPAKVNSIPTEKLDQLAPRPRDSSLDSSKLYDMIDHSFRDTRTAFEAMSK